MFILVEKYDMTFIIEWWSYEKKKYFYVTRFFIGVLILGVGYAAVTQVNLDITGSASFFLYKKYTKIFKNISNILSNE